MAQSIFGDISITTSNDMVNELLSSTGMRGMLNTIWLILSAMAIRGGHGVGRLAGKNHPAR